MGRGFADPARSDPARLDDNQGSCRSPCVSSFVSWSCRVSRTRLSPHEKLACETKVTEGVSGHPADFLLFSKRTATVPSYGKSIHVPHLRALRGRSLVSSKLLKSRKSAVCPETPSVTLLQVFYFARRAWTQTSHKVLGPDFH